MQFRAGTTATGEGLRFARSYHLTTSHGARINASHVVIVLTDGQSTNMAETISEAQILKDHDIEIIGIGVGSSVNQYELDHMATDRNHVFNVGSFDILHTILDEIRDESCEGKNRIELNFNNVIALRKKWDKINQFLYNSGRFTFFPCMLFIAGDIDWNYLE